jgi:hypothetical protein
MFSFLFMEVLLFALSL